MKKGAKARKGWLAAIGLIVAATPLGAQTPSLPPLPARYRVELRYDITAPRDRHVAQYDAMIEHLKHVGFVFDPPLEKHPETDREDPGKNLLTGTLPSESLLTIFANSHIASILAVPEGLDLPEDASTPVRVRLEVAGGMPPARQRELLEQLRAILYDLGFKEALAYDHRGHTKAPFTRLVGTLPAGKLATLRRDLRGYPFGWFAPPITLDDVPAPLRHRHPILVTEVLTPVDLRPFTDDAAALPPEGLEKIETELWKAFGPKILKGEAGEALRVEIFLAGSTSPSRPPSVAPLKAAVTNLLIVLQVGNIVTGFIDIAEIQNLARVPEVTLIRLPRDPLGPVAATVRGGDEREEILRSHGLDALFAKGKKGKGVRLAIVDKDFRAWQAMVDAGKLPRSTRLIDLTWQEDPDFNVLPEAGGPDVPGHGTQCAMAAALAAPEVELTLIRIPGNTIHELVELGRFLQGNINTTTLAAIQDVLTSMERDLLHERTVLLRERKEILESTLDDADEKRTFRFLGPVYGWVFNERAWHYERVKHQEKLERDMQDRLDRYRRLIAQIASLKGTQLVVNTRNWPTGYALGGASSIARWFDEQATSGPIWISASGNTRGQAWTGKFRDDDGNGVMEFAPPTTKLKPGRWTHELGFLTWQPWQDAKEPDSATMRLTVQWRETHSTDYFLNPRAARKEDLDPYARPLARLDVLLLRQVDPDGDAVGADVFELVARNAAAPVRLEYQPGTAVYEASFVADLNLGSKYAIRVISPMSNFWTLAEVEEGKPVYLSLRRENSRFTRPPGAPSLPELEPRWELEPRIFLETLGPAALAGRIVFADIATDAGTLGLPAEARKIWSVGAIDAKGKARDYSALGPPAFAELSVAPALRAPDAVHLTGKGEGGAFGTSLSAALAAGWIASAATGVFERERVLYWLSGWRGRVIGWTK